MRLAKYFLIRGHQVRLGSNNPALIPESLLEKVEVLPCILESRLQMAHLTFEIDAIFHLASPNAHFASKNPILSKKIVEEGTYNLLDAAKSNQVKKFILFSSVHVYRKPLVGLIDEDSPAENIEPYARNHIAAETILRNNHQNISYAIFRISNAVGYSVNNNKNIFHLVANDLAQQAVANGVMNIMGPKSTLRDFVSIHDVCKASFLMASMKSELPNTIFNISSSNAISLEKLSNIIQEQMVNLGYKEPIINFLYQGISSAEENILLEVHNMKIIQYLNMSFESIEVELSKLLRYLLDKRIL